jgi:hypothetical protein
MAEPYIPTIFPNGIQAGQVRLGDSSTKTSANIAYGYTKFDNRPSGGSTGDYTAQIRGVVGKTTGTYIGLDGETHLASTGTTSIRGIQGVAVLDATYTSTGGSLIGTYGQARADGTYNYGGGFMAGIYGLIEASAAITASHVCSAWFDSHQANAVTGSHQLVYMTNNGAAQMDEVMYIYGGDKITSFAKFDTCDGMVSDTAETGGTAKKIKIDIDGVTHYINAYTG